MDDETAGARTFAAERFLGEILYNLHVARQLCERARELRESSEADRWFAARHRSESTLLRTQAAALRAKGPASADAPSGPCSPAGNAVLAASAA